MNDTGFWFKFWLMALGVLLSAAGAFWAVVQLIESGSPWGLPLSIVLLATWATGVYWLADRTSNP